MKHYLIDLTAIVLVAWSVSGCPTAVRLIETQAGVGVKKTTETETRKTKKLNRKDIQMRFKATGNNLNFRLQYQPYYEIEQRREITKNNPDGSILDNLLGAAEYMGVASAFLLVLASEGNKDLEDWQKVLLIGVPIDRMLFWLTRDYSSTKYTPWQPVKIEPGPLEWITGQHYRIDLPAYNFSKKYRTKSGDERIYLSDFLSSMKDPSPLRKIRSIDVRASAQIKIKNGSEITVKDPSPWEMRLIGDQTSIQTKNYSKTITISDQAGLRVFHNTAKRTKQPKLQPLAEASAQWVKGNLQAGKTAKLKVTVKNTGKGGLYAVIAKTESSNPAFNNRKLKFGDIKPGNSKTLELSFKTDKLMRTRDIPIDITFDEYNDYEPPDIPAKLHIVEKPRPRFDYAYRIIDDNTGKSVGNGDGIIQRGESVDILLTVRNSGTGTAEGVTTRLNLSGGSGVEMFGDSSVRLGNIAPGDSKIASFNVGVKPNSSVRSLRLNLSIREGQFGNEVWLIDSIELPINQEIPPKIMVLQLDGTTTANFADIHSGADAKTSVIARIRKKNSRVKITGQLGDWYRLELKELTGWIHAKQISTQKIPPQSTTSTTVVERVFQQMPPQLTLVEPEQNRITVNTATMNLTAVATDDKGIGRIEVTVNRQPIEGRGISVKPQPSPSQTSITIKESIPLSYGENRIELIAFNTDGQASEPIVISATRTREMGELWVVSVGISDYQHKRIPDLRYTDDDAKAVADYFHSIGVPNDHIILLRDRQATAVEIRRVFGELMGKAKETATVVIYFSGHGAPTPNLVSPDGDGIDKYMLTYEADPSNFYGTAFPMDEVAGIFKRLASDRVVFIADTCYSGATGGKTVLAKDMAGSKRAIEPNYEQFLSRLTEGEGRVILTACRGNELAQESRKFRHGVFTHFLLKGLRGAADGNRDGFITISEAYDYVFLEVPKHANQHPVWKGEASGIVIGRVK